MNQAPEKPSRKSSDVRRSSSSSAGSVTGPRLLSVNKEQVKKQMERDFQNPDLLELEKNVAAKIGLLIMEKKEREMSSFQDEKEAV